MQDTSGHGNADAGFTESVPLLPTESGHSGSETSTDGDKGGAPNAKKTGYSLFVAICFALNYSVGSGILGLPYEYFKSGFFLGSVLLCYLGLLTYITYCFVMDGMQRAEAITFVCKQHNMDAMDWRRLSSLDISPNALSAHYSFTVNEYQLSSLLGLFGGKWWKLLYDVSYGLATLIALWSYSALFGISLARNIGIPGIAVACDMAEDGDDANTGCRGLYSFYVALFWVWTCVLSLMDFSEQQGVQMAATFARVIIIGLMVLTCIGLIYSNWHYDGRTYHYLDDDTSESYAEGVSPWKWSGLAYMMAVCAFAYGNQYCVTDIIEPLSMHDRHHSQHRLWAYSVGICCAVYVCCGISISLYFGGNTESPCTLAWRGFMGFEETDTQPIWALIVSWFIVLFPAIDIGSAYPLNVVTLANTIEEAIIPKVEVPESEQAQQPPSNAIFTYENRYNILFRLLICTSTAILALIEWNFDLILAISGAFGLLAVYGGPVVLEWKSKSAVHKITRGVDANVHKTPMTKTWVDHTFWLLLIGGTVVVAFIAVFIDIIEGYS